MAEDIGNLAVRVGMDSSGFNDGIAQINRRLRVANSDFRANTAAIGSNGTALDRLRLRHTSLTSSMGLQQQKVNALEAAYNRSVAATGADSRATQDLEVRLNQARASLSNMGNQLGDVDRQIATQTSSWTRLGTALNNAGARMKKAGEGMTKVGKELSMKVTAPIVGLGVAVGKMSMDFEGSMAKVSTISNDAEVPIGDLRKAILNLSDDSGIASSEIANNVYDAISAGQSTGDAVNFVTNSTKLAKAGFAEAGQSLDLLTTIMNSYELESKEVNKVSDVLIQTQNKGKVTVGELSSSMGKIIPTANQYGVELEQVASGYAIMTSKGIKSAEATTYMNSMLNELGKSGTVANKALQESTGKTFPELIKSGKSVGDILAIMDKNAKENEKSLTDMFGSAEAGKAALVLSNNAGKDFNAMLKEMENSAGATDTAFEKVSDTTGERLTKSLNSLKNAGIKLGDSLSPIIEKIASGVKSLTDKFNKLTPEQQDNIVKFGLIAAAVGPVLLVVGKLVTIGGALTTGLGAISTAMGAASVATAGVGTAAAGAAGAAGIGGIGVALGGAVVAAAPFLLAGAAVVGTGLLIKNAMEKEVVPSVDLFADKVTYTADSVEKSNDQMGTSYKTTTTTISDATKVAVGKYIELDDQATKALDSLYINGTIVTKKILDDTTLKYNAINTNVKTAMDKRFAEEYKTMVAFYAKSDVLTKTQEEKALLAMQEKHKKEKTEEDKATAEILAIIKKRLDKNEALTLEDEQAIKVIQDRKKIDAIKVMSAQEAESKVIIERLTSYGKRMTAEQASTEIKNANKSRDGTIKAANEKYTKTVATIKATTDQSTPEGKKLADNLIREAKRQKDESIKKAEEMRKGVVDKVVSMDSDTSKNVNLTTGNIITAWDKVKSWWSNWFPAKKTVSVTTNQHTNYTSKGSRSIPGNAAGTNDFEGGLTTMHEKGYEVYNLNKGSQILNHEASLDLVTKTAEAVARKVMASSQNNGVTQTVIVPVSLDGREIAKVVAKPMMEEMQFYINQNNLGGSR
jgi:TP901 family phage tail tape measure protein